MKNKIAGIFKKLDNILYNFSRQILKGIIRNKNETEIN